MWLYRGTAPRDCANRNLVRDDLDIGGIASNPLRVVVFLLLLLAIRGLPSPLTYRKGLALTRALAAATTRLTDAVP